MLVKSGYAPIHDLQLYYEIHGSGQPLVLLHGGLGGIGTVSYTHLDVYKRQIVTSKLELQPI